MAKWILAALGYAIFRFPGALIGFLLGSFIDNAKVEIFKGGNWSRGSSSSAPPVGIGDFELNLLSLSSIVIKADGQVNQTELDYVRQYFVQAYGKERANATFKTFNNLIKNREINTARLCMMIVQRTRYEARLQILHFLFNIAKADGAVSSNEAEVIQSIAGYLRIHSSDFMSIRAMFFREADNAYKILNISKTATDAEVKKAFRDMAKKYHPDKVQHLGEVHIKGAEEKFREVQNAYEQIQKERGMV